jgi:hypothetical protein
LTWSSRQEAAAYEARMKDERAERHAVRVRCHAEAAVLLNELKVLLATSLSRAAEIDVALADLREESQDGEIPLPSQMARFYVRWQAAVTDFLQTFPFPRTPPGGDR